MNPAQVYQNLIAENKGMNRLEKRYANYLHNLFLGGEIIFFKFEQVKLKLSDRTYYTPDFLVVTKESKYQIHEVKGFWRDDARVKIKIASREFPCFEFMAVKVVQGKWSFEYFFERGIHGKEDGQTRS